MCLIGTASTIDDDVRFTLDTNILVYALRSEASERREIAQRLLRLSKNHACVLTLQSLGELFRVLTSRKVGLPPSEAAAIVNSLRDAMPVVSASQVCLDEAMDADVHHGWSFWDAMIWATAKQHGCRLLITEDGQSGRTLGGVTLVNPFLPDAGGFLAAALGRG